MNSAIERAAAHSASRCRHRQCHISRRRHRLRGRRRGRLPCGRRHQSHRRRARVRGHRRAHGMRQIHAAQRGRRAARRRRRGRSSFTAARLAGLNRAAGYLFQQDAVMPWKTARDNVAIGLEIAGIAAQRSAASAPSLARSASGSRAFGDRYPHQLSGGQRKRVGLAQVLIRDPKILLMDEPFGPLDAQTRQIMGNLLLDLWAARPQGRAVRHPRPGGGDRAGRPRGDHVGRARRPHHRRPRHRPAAAARCLRGAPAAALSRAAQGDLGPAARRGA